MNFDPSDVLIQSAEEREERDASRVLQQFPGVTGRIMSKLGIRTTVQGWVFTKHIRRIARSYIEGSATLASLIDEGRDAASLKAEKIKAAEHLISSLEEKMPWIRTTAPVDWPEEPSYQIVSYELSLYRAVRVRQQRAKESDDKGEAEVKGIEHFTGSFPSVGSGDGACSGNG